MGIFEERKLQEILQKLTILEDQMQLVLSKLTVGSAVTIRAKFERKPMSLSIALNKTDFHYYIIGTDANGLVGAQLGPGQTIAVTSADPTTVTFTPDATPQPDNEGVASVASGLVVPVKVGGPTSVSASVTNADGSAAESLTDTITVTPVVPGVATAIGDLFEEPLAASTLTSAKKR